MAANWTPEEQKEHRRLWVEALRSGKYQQAKGHLQNRGGMCCLGVACDISGLGKWKGRRYVTPGTTYVGDLGNNTSEMVRWLGLDDACGVMADGNALTELNDDGKLFAEIADIIESEPKGLLAAEWE